MTVVYKNGVPYIYCLTDLVIPELPTTDPSLPLSVSFIGGTPLVADGTVTVATAVNRDASVRCRLSGGAGTIDCKRLACMACYVHF